MQLTYKPNSAGIDTGTYDLTDHSFRGDPVACQSLNEIAHFLTSDHWEDRIRAELLRQQRSVTLPDQFPCIYETEDSPNQRRSGAHFRLHAWVKSPDISLLRAVLDDYQELWDGYPAQWGPGARRTFAVGLHDGLSPYGVYRPGATPAQVIGSTMLTHPDMYRWASERLKRMHPNYPRWQKAKGGSQ